MSHTSHDFGPSGEVHRRDDQAPGGRGFGFWRSRTALFTIAFLAIGAFFLLWEHWAHALGAFPYVLLLGFGLLHVFMHIGHGGHRGHGGHGGHRSSGSTDGPDRARGGGSAP